MQAAARLATDGCGKAYSTPLSLGRVGVWKDCAGLPGSVSRNGDALGVGIAAGAGTFGCSSSVRLSRALCLTARRSLACFTDQKVHRTVFADGGRPLLSVRPLAPIASAMTGHVVPLSRHRMMRSYSSNSRRHNSECRLSGPSLRISCSILAIGCRLLLTGCLTSVWLPSSCVCGWRFPSSRPVQAYRVDGRRQACPH
jgi:hypothetical protein